MVRGFFVRSKGQVKNKTKKKSCPRTRSLEKRSKDLPFFPRSKKCYFSIRSTDHFFIRSKDRIEKIRYKDQTKTKKEGLSQILPNGDLFLEETNFSRVLYFNADGSLRWTFVNRADNGKTYRIGWSRILYNNEDVQIIKNFLQSREKC